MSAGAIAAVLSVLGNPESPWSALVPGVLAICAGVAGSVLGASVAILVTRESHLFRYFKNR